MRIGLASGIAARESSRPARARLSLGSAVPPVHTFAGELREDSMSAETIAKSIQRVRALITSRPRAGIHADDPATARWEGSMRVVARHENGTELATDMPIALGGTGGQVSPGWLLRAALASCLTTRIVMAAAAEGIALSSLEARAASTSDARGLLGMMGDSGERIPAGPSRIELEVRIAASGVPAARLRALVEECSACSPVSDALQSAVPVTLRVEVLPETAP
jgi:uncharacterized OsmC-like protein